MAKPHKFIPRAKGLKPRQTGYERQRAMQQQGYLLHRARIIEALRVNPEHTAKSLMGKGFPYETANRILAELERAGLYVAPPERARARVPRSAKAAKRRQWLLNQFSAGKTIEQILSMPSTPFKSKRLVYRDIFNLRLAGKTIVVPIADSTEFQVASIEALIEKNPGIKNEEINRRVGIKSHLALIDRLRRANPAILQKRKVPNSNFSRAEISQQNELIAEMAAKGKSSKEIAAEIKKRFGAELTEQQINQRTSHPQIKGVVAGKRAIGRSSFSAEQISRQNRIIFGLAERSLTPAQIVGKPGLEGLSKKYIKDRLYRWRKSQRRG